MQSITSYVVKLLNIVNPVSNRLPIKNPFTYMTKSQYSDVIIQPEMVAIPSGIMPNSKDRHSRFNDREVTEFKLGKYPITVLQWRTIMTNLPAGNDKLSDEHPVMNINCKRVTKQLRQG
jgi:formylglycine-generating enzyme required for sulfatase activity